MMTTIMKSGWCPSFYCEILISSWFVTLSKIGYVAFQMFIKESIAIAVARLLVIIWQITGAYTRS